MTTVTTEHNTPRVLGRAIDSKDYIVQMSPKEYREYCAKHASLKKKDTDIVWSGSSEQYLTLLDDMIAQDAGKRA